MAEAGSEEVKKPVSVRSKKRKRDEMSADLGSESSEGRTFEELAKGYRIGKQLKPNPPPISEEGSGSAVN